MSKNRLGKGLGALLPSDEPTVDTNDNGANVLELNIEDIEPNPYQPRREFDQDLLKELSLSIKEFGLIQPISVRKINDTYQLVAGERRLRAATMAGLATIPAIEKDVDDKQLMEPALIENLQREDLNPIEEALAYKKLMDRFQLTQEEVANRVSKSRSAIANTIRLLNLPDEIQEYVSRETISMGHARALLGLNEEDEMLPACEKCIREEMNVRQLEDYIKFLKGNRDRQNKNTEKDKVVGKKAADVVQLEERLTTIFQSTVKIDDKKRRVTIECRNLEELNDVLAKLQRVRD